MKIVLASHHFPPDRLGGVELVTLKAARWLHRHGHSVEVVAIERATEGAPDRVEERREVYEGIPVTRLTIDLFAPGVPWAWHYRHPVIEAWFQQYLEAARPDLAHVQSCYLLSVGAIHAACDAGCATVVSLHDYWFACPLITMLRPDGATCDASVDPYTCAWCLMTARRRYRYLDAATGGLAGRAVARALRQEGLALALVGPAGPTALQLRRRAVDEALRRAHALVTPSPYVRRLLIERGFPAAQVELVTHGLELGPAALTARAIEPPSRAGRFAYLGQVHPSKGVHVLLRAFRRLRRARAEAELHIHGGEAGTPYERRLRAMAGEGDGVHWHGPYAPAEVWRVLQEVDVVVVPSLWREIGPLVMCEGLAAGRPVVASDLPNMNEQVHHEVNGLLFQPGDASDLEEQLRRLVDEDGLVKRLRAGIGPPRSSEQEMADMLAVYRQAMAAASGTLAAVADVARLTATADGGC